MIQRSAYTPTEAKYKGTARDCFISYDLEQETRGKRPAIYPKVKRVYIAGDVKDWEVGRFKKKSGKAVYGVRIDYEQQRDGYHRQGYTAERNGKSYHVPATDVQPSASHYVKIIEIPEDAQNVQFHAEELPEKYRSALQDVS